MPRPRVGAAVRVVLRKDNPMSLYSRSRASALLSLVATLLNMPAAWSDGSSGLAGRASNFDSGMPTEPVRGREAGSCAITVDQCLDRLEL